MSEVMFKKIRESFPPVSGKSMFDIIWKYIWMWHTTHQQKKTNWQNKSLRTFAARFFPAKFSCFLFLPTKFRMHPNPMAILGRERGPFGPWWIDDLRLLNFVKISYDYLVPPFLRVEYCTLYMHYRRVRDFLFLMRVWYIYIYTQCIYIYTHLYYQGDANSSGTPRPLYVYLLGAPPRKFPLGLVAPCRENGGGTGSCLTPPVGAL